MPVNNAVSLRTAAFLFTEQRKALRNIIISDTCGRTSRALFYATAQSRVYTGRQTRYDDRNNY
jgi:hypothetical protein